MATKCENGLFKTENGQWGYRFSLLIDGHRVSRRKTTDNEGNKLTSKRAATKAREAAIAAAHAEVRFSAPLLRKTVSEVYEEYAQKGRSDRAYNTILKQDSLWKNHISSRFGSRFIDEISSAEVMDYLSELYYQDCFSYMYTEAFLKMFYLLFGQAHSRDYISAAAYNKLCVNKDSKIRMPKMKAEDDREIISYSQEQLLLLDHYFAGTAAETAYLLGRYCGLRINECYGLKWENVDVEEGTILIDRQMQYQNGVIRLVAPKTRNAKRTIYMSSALKVYFQKIAQQRAAEERELAAVRQQNQKMIEDIDGQMIHSTALVNCLPNGKIQTVNSMKYHAKEIQKRLGITFKYHHLRHTYGTMMAEMNTPTHLLCNQMGHGNIHVTQRYYIATSKSGIEILKAKLNQL